ncbi:MAG: glutamine--fructose-6-phosphate transaminase (isomerizing) [Oscillospiraceae bacterium]|nr:glutamine--fructose-6-phosphate transaminase (isomerizing) [Oscillospiraceae bacterium]
MCGIVGYAGSRQAAPVLLDGLEKLEYRGYDSAGVCVHNENGLEPVKAKGRLSVLRDRLEGGSALPGSVGIGHTRWATHGAPSDRNSHPHMSWTGKIAVVHNGIIENEARLREKMLRKGATFSSETDTEVVANLIGYYYEKYGDFVLAVREAVVRLEGSFALGILCKDVPGKIVAVKKDSPLIFGFGEGENFIASDVPAILKYTQTVAYLEDGDMAVFDGDSVEFFDSTGEPTEKKREKITWEMSAAERGGYDHFMMKEIYEQPKALRDTISPRLRNGQVTLEGIDLSAEYLKGLRKIYLVACGSAYYVSVLAKYIIEKTCRIACEAMMASEFRYCDPVVGKDNLVIFVSQSGETADTLAALREAKARGAQTLAIVNVVGSAIAKAADQVIYTWAGPEIAVATTKAFTTQLSVVYLLAMQMAKTLGTMSVGEYNALISGLESLPYDVERVLSQRHLERCQYLASRYHAHHDAFYIGRNVDSGICMEGSLKLKEIAYLHSEAYPAGELKHGPISLIEDGTLVVALATIEPLFDKTMANIKEVKARGADVLCVTLEGYEEQAEKIADSIIAVPEVHPLLQPSLSIIPLQLFSYYVALYRGCDVDKPRNLAKSVTVE